jgi:drug/metabolite transporter (DMT)-like permease
MRKAYFQLHLAVLLWGFTAIFGKLISLNELWLVWYRMILSTVALWIYLRLTNSLHKPNKKTLLKAAGIGAIICLHWITFYGAIKASNISVAISCFSSLALFTALLDPLINRKKIQLPEILLGLAVIGGIGIIFSAQEFYMKGILMAIVSAFLAALFTILNKQLYYENDPGTISVIELGSGFLFLTLLIPSFIQDVIPMPSTMDWLWLILLSTLCTSFAFTLGNYALQKLDSFTVNLTVNLEPVYSIILAIILFNENRMLNTGFYTGSVIILASVVVHTIYKYRLARK